MLDHTKQIVFAGRVVAFAGPADEARDAHGRWVAEIDKLPDRDYDKRSIKVAAGVNPAGDLGFAQARSYVQGKIDQNKRYLASMANWRPEERDPVEEKEIETHNTILQGAMEHGSAIRVPDGEKPQWQMPYLEWVGKHGAEHATQLAQSHAKPGTSIRKEFGHEWKVVSSDGKSESGSRTLGKRFRDPFAAAKASWEFEPHENGMWYKTGKAPRGLPGKMKKSAALVPEKHREIVEQAVREGKPVPADVLEHYPDLSKQPTNKSVDPGEAVSQKRVEDVMGWLQKTLKPMALYPSSDPYGYHGFDSSGHEAAKNKIVDFVESETDKNHFRRPTVREVYDHVRSADKSLSIEDFKGLLANLQSENKISFGAWTQALATVPKADVPYLTVLDREFKNYVGSPRFRV